MKWKFTGAIVYTFSRYSRFRYSMR